MKVWILKLKEAYGDGQIKSFITSSNFVPHARTLTRLRELGYYLEESKCPQLEIDNPITFEQYVCDAVREYEGLPYTFISPAWPKRNDEEG